MKNKVYLYFFILVAFLVFIFSHSRKVIAEVNNPLPLKVSLPEQIILNQDIISGLTYLLSPELENSMDTSLEKMHQLITK